MFHPKKQIKSTNFFKPKKNWGQNFLKNPEIASNVVAAAAIIKSDTIIEVGPGTGILTEELVKTGAKIYAIEKDFELVEKLKRNIGTPKNLKIVHQDALWFDHSTISGKFKVVANIPYNITSPLIRKFIEGENKPELMVLMVQKEVAERITAKPGDSNRGYLTLIVEFYADAEILFEVSRNEFYPVPKVDSAVVKITTNRPHLRSGVKEVQPEFFFKIVKAGFAAKRKQVHNSLAATLRLDQDIVLDILKKANIESTLRAEDLTLDQWIELYKNTSSSIT